MADIRKNVVLPVFAPVRLSFKNVFTVVEHGQEQMQMT
jgi:hypothetical protein